jgi:hypothetical protein
MKRILLALLAVALVLLGCENPSGGDASPVEDPVSTPITATSLGTYDSLYVIRNDNRTAIVQKIEAASKLEPGINLSIPQLPTDASEIVAYSEPDNRVSTPRKLTVSLNANPGFSFNPDLAYTFGSTGAKSKTAGSVTFELDYTVVDGKTGHSLESLTLAGRVVTLTSSTAGTVTIPYPGSGAVLGYTRPVLSTNARVTAVATVAGNDAENTINTQATSGTSNYDFSGTNKYLQVKVAAAETGGESTIYRILVTVDTPYKPYITTSNTAPTLGTGNVIRFNGAQSGDTPAAAIEGVVQIASSNVSLGSGSYSPSGVVTPRYLVNRGATPADAEFTGTSTVFDFSDANTLWIRLQIIKSGEVLTSRYYKVRVLRSDL